ncbi:MULTISPECIES: helix-turn-helix domain-containing protein [unclassified Pseudomonas]|uniref:helix-turn-helix domain-containing protein n=1 Tax=unclassified Pseudomonas TaxID=196821 RepID=UPI0023B92963|nr:MULTISPECIES: helix-turn-helix domain-containing protein [unclassified Pseudomonas]
MNTAWQGRLWLASDYCLLDGCAGDTQTHAHYAHQLMLAHDGELRLMVGGQLLQSQRLLVPSMQPHAFIEPGQPMLALYTEPLSFRLEHLKDWQDEAPTQPQALIERFRHWPRPPLDTRVEQALLGIDALLQEKIDATELASQVRLSLSQLERLFGDQVGLSIRRLVLWRRLRLALAMVLRGSNLTAAAHAASFADSAHFSRTVRSMFGIQARALHNLQLQLLD